MVAGVHVIFPHSLLPVAKFVPQCVSSFYSTCSRKFLVQIRTYIHFLEVFSHQYNICAHYLRASASSLLTSNFIRQIITMGGLSDIFYPDNPKRREHVAALCANISSDIKFIEKAVNDNLEKCNEYLKEKTALVSSDDKTINQFFLDVRAAFEATDRAAHA